MDFAAFASEASAVCIEFPNYFEAEEKYNRQLYLLETAAFSGGDHHQTGGATKSVLVTEIQQARQKITESLKHAGDIPVPMAAGVGSNEVSKLNARVDTLEKQNCKMQGELSDLRKLVDKLHALTLNTGTGSTQGKTAVPATHKPEPEKKAAKDEDEEDEEEEIDLFGSDEEDDEEKEKLKAERLKAYADKKQKKPALIAKSSVIFDVKPWDDETDMGDIQKSVRSIQMDGLVWGAAKLVPLAYGIQKLQIMCVVEDEKVSIDELQEKIQDFEDLVQSVDIAAFNKI